MSLIVKNRYLELGVFVVLFTYEVFEMKLKIICLVLSCVVLTACSSEEAYNTKVKNGFYAVQQEEFEKALGYFKSAEKLKRDDESLSIYINQLKNLRKAEDSSFLGDEELAAHYIKKVVHAKKGSPIIVEKALEIRDQLRSI